MFLCGSAPTHLEAYSEMCVAILTVLLAFSILYTKSPLFVLPCLPAATYALGCCMRSDAPFSLHRCLVGTGFILVGSLTISSLLRRYADVDVTDYSPPMPRIIVEHVAKAVFEGNPGYYHARLEDSYLNTGPCATETQALNELFAMLEDAGKSTNKKHYIVMMLQDASRDEKNQ